MFAFAKNVIMLKGDKSYFPFVNGIVWFSEILRPVLFAGRLTLKYAINQKVKISFSRPTSVKCGSLHTLNFVVKLLIKGEGLPEGVFFSQR